MANAGPNTGGSQFFINMKDNTQLDFDKAPLTSAHAVFGVVRDGWNVVDSISHVPTGFQNKPNSPVIMDSLRVTGSYLSVEEIERNKTVSKIYPNPISSQSVVDFYSARSGEISLSIYNQHGTALFTKNLFVEAGKTQLPLHQLKVLQLHNGVYFLQIKTGNTQIVERFVVLQ